MSLLDTSVFAVLIAHIVPLAYWRCFPRFSLGRRPAIDAHLENGTVVIPAYRPKIAVRSSLMTILVFAGTGSLGYYDGMLLRATIVVGVALAGVAVLAGLSDLVRPYQLRLDPDRLVFVRGRTRLAIPWSDCPALVPFFDADLMLIVPGGLQPHHFEERGLLGDRWRHGQKYVPVGSFLRWPAVSRIVNMLWLHDFELRPKILQGALPALQESIASYKKLSETIDHSLGVREIEAERERRWREMRAELVRSATRPDAATGPSPRPADSHRSSPGGPGGPADPGAPGQSALP